MYRCTSLRKKRKIRNKLNRFLESMTQYPEFVSTLTDLFLTVIYVLYFYVVNLIKNNDFFKISMYIYIKKCTVNVFFANKKSL